MSKYGLVSTETVPTFSMNMAIVEQAEKPTQEMITTQPSVDYKTRYTSLDATNYWCLFIHIYKAPVANGQGYWENSLQRILLPISDTWNTFILPVDGNLYT